MYCLVDGGWSSWRHGSCSMTCGGGIRTSTRTCNNPAPSCGGNDCSGSNIRHDICNTRCCLSKKMYKYYFILSSFNINACNHYAVNGGWSSWEYGSCSKSCGGGTQRLIRRCNNPTPICGGTNCPGSNIRQITCNNQCCPGMNNINIIICDENLSSTHK